MTDAEWRNGQTGYELLAMLAHVQTQWDERRGCLFLAAVMRRIWDLLTDPRFRELVEAAERRGRCVAPNDFETVRERLPRIGNWRPPEPSALLEPVSPRGARPFYLGGPPSHIPPPGVLNFRELPSWVQMTHHAAVNLGEFNYRGVVVYAVSARSGHTAEQSVESHPFDDQIAAIHRETDRLQREYDDAVWRGMSSAMQKGDALRLRREQADAQICELNAQMKAEQNAVRNEIASVASAAEHAAQADLLRCIAGNPFAPVIFDPRWRTETVTSLARGIVAERAYDRLPVLADALEEAGCDHPDLLAHCRSSGPHAAGCWVLEGLDVGGQNSV